MKERRGAAVKFYLFALENATEMDALLQIADEDDAMNKTQVYEWFSRFKNVQMSLEDQPRSRRPATSRTDEKTH